jgi:hypothetical protein
MVSPVFRNKLEATTKEIGVCQGDDAACLKVVTQRIQEALVKQKASGDSACVEGTSAAGTKSRKVASKARRQGAVGEPRLYISTPLGKREEARAAGLRWDSDARKWYAPSQEIADRIKKARLGDGRRNVPSSPAAGRPVADSNR